METQTRVLNPKGASTETIIRYAEIIEEFRGQAHTKPFTSEQVYRFFKERHLNTAIVPQLKYNHMNSFISDTGERMFQWKTIIKSSTTIAAEVLQKYNEDNAKSRRAKTTQKQLKRAEDFPPLYPVEQKPMNTVVKTLEDKIRTIDAHVVSTQEEINDLTQRLADLRQQREEYYTTLDVLEKLNKTTHD